MIKVITERAIPAGFDASDDAQVAAHCRIAVDAMKTLGGRMHWICSYVTDTSLFGVVVFESDTDLAAYQRAAGQQHQKITVHRVLRVIDASLAR